ncbi:Ask1p [Saccharomyces cerevisiae x Saccharomyces kudriavzevii VIN7]|uniref:Ask1p n=1 Tax=Saccharomyces cerevisiae x Saccharomyces kudriavzevii (strain VIN7) TaxID=1095631 RepID=H0GXI7_SACCK|nr:Ask1p [Saccharomyces cerevisiae x Saccharomyces kudriavzevii VIN7]
MFTNDNTDDFHTANITSTGQILKLPDSSDEDTALSSSGQRDFTEEDHEDAGNDQDESTIQRQSRKRKISLLLQQQYGSSSSIVPSPIMPNKMRKQLPRNHYNNIGDDGDENSNNIESSPLKQEHLLKERVDDGNEGPDEEENTKEVPKPGTIIHFSTNR